MATSGTLNTSSYEGRYYQFSWSAEQSITNNRSTISWTLSAVGGDASWYAERTLTLKAAGSTLYTKTDRVERYPGVIKTGSFVINHASDGTASFSASIDAAVYVSTINCTGSKTFTLDTIPRKSTLSVGSGTLGTAQTLTVTRKSTNFTHTITATCGSASTTVCTKSSSTSISFTPPLSWSSQNTTGTTVSVKYTITTYNGSTSVGSNSYTTTCSIPSSVKPSCSIGVSDPTTCYNIYGGYIQGVSKFKVTVTPTPAYGSDIKSYSVTANGATYTDSSFTTGVISGSGSLTISAKVTDSRGRTSNTATATVSVLSYFKPKINILKLIRCDNDGTENMSGEYIKITYDAAVADLNGKNSAKYTLQYKKSSESSYTSILAPDDGEFDVSAGLSGTNIIPADSGSSYDVRLTITDNLYTSKKETVVSTAFTLLHWLASGLGMAIGKVSELTNVLDIGFQTRFMGGFLQPVLPAGSDFNDFKTPNTYTLDYASNLGYINGPTTNLVTGTLTIKTAGSSGQVEQMVSICSKTAPKFYVRYYYGGSWGDWIELY